MIQKEVDNPKKTRFCPFQFFFSTDAIKLQKSPFFYYYAMFVYYSSKIYHKIWTFFNVYNLTLKFVKIDFYKL